MVVPAEFEDYYRLARGLYQTGPAHDFHHIERVFKLALTLGRAEGADLAILGTAALFHDLAREEEARSGGQVCHALAGAAETERILSSLGKPDSFIRAVSNTIATHRFRDDNHPTSIEGKCLYDADKLDSLGAVGIARAYLWLGQHGGTVYVPREIWEKSDFTSNRPEDDSLQREWHIKFRYIKDKLYTKTAKEIAAKREKTMKDFLVLLEREVNGEE